MTLQRTHILLKPEQQKALADMAMREGRSVSDLAREIIQQGIDERQKQNQQLLDHRLATLEKLRLLRESIAAKRGGKYFDVDVVQMLNEMREERTDEILGLGR